MNRNQANHVDNGHTTSTKGWVLTYRKSGRTRRFTTLEAARPPARCCPLRDPLDVTPARAVRTVVSTLQVKGFRCLVDEAVFLNRPGGYAHLVSLVGTREAVKAVWARLMKGEAAFLYTGSETRPVRIETLNAAKLLTERLPSGAFHGLLLSHKVLSGELVLCETEAELPTRFFHLLTQALNLPLHDAWKDWLWAHTLSIGALSELTSQRLHAYEVSFSIGDFEKAVRVALVKRDLPEIEVHRAA